jgi:hypothetical protein
MNNLETKNSTSNTSKKSIQITLIGLPKISLNEWYAGNHWTKRKAIKDKYYWIIKSQFKDVLSKSNKYQVDYTFYFKLKPLDASNCIAMVKMIEDIIFEDDNYKIVEQITISSKKGMEDIVIINIIF